MEKKNTFVQQQHKDAQTSGDITLIIRIKKWVEE